MRAGFGDEASARRKAMLALLAVAALILVVNQFTGWITNIVSIAISVAASAQGNIYVVNASDNVIQHEEAYFVVALDNVGSEALEGMIYAEIRDSANTTVDSFNSSYYLIQPGSYITYKAEWYATQPPGEYTLVAWDNYTGPTDMESFNFSISCMTGTYRCFGNERWVCRGTYWEFIETCAYSCLNGACLSAPPSIPSPMGPPPPSCNMSLEYDGVIRAVQGMNYTHIIRATNNGEAPLTDLSLQASSWDVGVRIPEITVPVISPGGSVSFVLDLGVPVLPLGDYNVSFVVRSQEILRDGVIVVRVVSTLEDYLSEEYCMDSIERYFTVLDSLDMDIRSAEMKGYGMESVRVLLGDALEELTVMRTLRDKGLHDECGNRVDILRRKLEQTAMAYAVAISRPVSIVAYPWIEHLILIFTVIALAVIIVIIVGWRKITEWYRRNRLVLPSGW